MIPNKDGIVVSPTEPTTNRRKVWMQKGKNFFNNNNLKVVSAWQANCSIDVNKKITAQCTGTSGVSYIRINSVFLKAGTYTFSATITGQLQSIRVYKSNETTITSFNTSTGSFTVEEDCYVFFRFYIWVSTSNSIAIENIQVEQGSEATGYESYINPTIYIKNDNDVYEEFIKKNIVSNSKIESTEDTYSCDYINSNLEIEQANDLLVAQSGYSFLDTNIFRQGRHYFGNVVVKKNSGNFTNVQALVAKLSKTIKGVYNSGCFLTNNQYSVHDVGYCYIGGTDFYVADHKEKGYNYAKIHIDLVVN